MAPASTGKERRRSKVVITTAQTKRGTFSGFILLGRIFLTVAMKLIDPRIEDAPAK